MPIKGRAASMDVDMFQFNFCTRTCVRTINITGNDDKSMIYAENPCICGENAMKSKPVLFPDVNTATADTAQRHFRLGSDVAFTQLH